MDQIVTEDSYADRRQLFKSIWQTAMTIDEKDPDIMNKPKVIKTLRLDEVDRFGINKQKKLRLKNLRAVCNKILDFCDKQEADDLLYAKMNATGPDTQCQSPTRKHKKDKTRVKTKSRKLSNILTSTVNPIKTIAEGEKEGLNKKKSINISPIKPKYAPIVKTALIAHSIKSPTKQSRISSPSKGGILRQKEMKKNVKKYKESQQAMMSRSSGTVISERQHLMQKVKESLREREDYISVARRLLL